MKSKLRLIAESALEHTPNRILDIGYAQDPNPYLKERGATVFGVDIVAKPASYDKTFICDLNTDTLPFTDASLQAVTMGCTLAHVASPLKTMADINRVLAEGGGGDYLVAESALLLGKCA